MNKSNPIAKNTKSIIKVLKSLKCIDDQNRINKEEFDRIGISLVQRNGFLSFTSTENAKGCEFTGSKLPSNVILKLNHKNVVNLSSNR